MALPYDPNFEMSVRIEAREPIDSENDGDQVHDASASAAVVALYLISSARLAVKLDSVYTEYSAQYLVDNACPKKERGTDLELTVKDCLEFALKEGIPKAEDWPSSHKPALVSMKGEVIEAKNMMETDDWLWDQPVGARLHVFTPHIDLQREGIYCGSSGEESCYVGLRDGIIVRVEKINGKSIAIVKLWYKKEFRFVNVAMSRMFAHATLNRDDGSLDFSQGIKPTFLIVDFCFPRLSII